MGGPRRCAWAWRAAPALACAAFALVAVAQAPASPGSTAAVVAAERIDERLHELTIATPALHGETKVRVLLPQGYGEDGRRRYPVLYLLHGAGGDQTDWSEAGDAAAATAGRPLIVVMPSGGRAGWYTNWSNDGAGGPPAWERYHVGQLVPLVDRRFRTVAARRGRAIAGLSMGGFGAFSYAARHPGMFTAAASYSGGVDLNAEYAGLPIGKIAVDGSLALHGFDGVTGATLFGGDFVNGNIRWRAHNPVDLAANLRGLKLALYVGNGQPGPLDPSESNPDPIEIGAHAMNVNLHDRLAGLGVRHRWVDYGPGLHSWPYWRRGLRQTMPWLMARFNRSHHAPGRVTYTAVERAYRAYGWRVRLRRPNAEFSTLSNADRRGFVLTGSGRAVVRTPPRYRPGARYLARITRARDHSGDRARGAVRVRRLVAMRSGMLRIPVRLARTNSHDEGSPDAEGGRFHTGTVRVAFKRAGPPATPHQRGR